MNEYTAAVLVILILAAPSILRELRAPVKQREDREIK
jgi:hypothetical protein